MVDFEFEKEIKPLQMIIEVLKEEFAERCRKNPQYSLRAFARSLKMHSSTLSAMLNQKRKITPKGAYKILQELDLDPMIKRKIYLSLLEVKTTKAPVYYQVLDDEILEVISGWEHFAILSLLELNEAEKTISWMLKHINASYGQLVEALERLEKAGLIRQDGSSWILIGKNWTTSNDVPNSALQKAHREYMEKALYSLEHHSVEERDITGITLAISTRKLAKAKRLIAEFRREMSEFMEVDPKDAVYRLNIQLFPLKK